MKFTWSVHSFVVLYWFLRRFTKTTDFSSIAPEAIISRVLFLNELIVVDVGGEVCVGLSAIAVLGDLSKSGAKFILTSFARDVSAVTRYLCSWVGLTHDNIYNFQ